MTIQTLTHKALSRYLEGKTELEVFRYVDEHIPIPDCPLKKQKALWEREQVKASLQAAMRQTKTTGPSQIK